LCKWNISEKKKHNITSSRECKTVVTVLVYKKGGIRKIKRKEIV